MVDTTKTAPFVATVHKIANIEGRTHASFDGLNSWYFVPPHLQGVIGQAAKKRRPIRITTSRSEILTAELEG